MVSVTKKKKKRCFKLQRQCHIFLSYYFFYWFHCCLENTFNVLEEYLKTQRCRSEGILLTSTLKLICVEKYTQKKITI